MVLRLATSLCLIFTITVAATCEFFRASRRGILIAHWVFICWLTAESWNGFQQGELPALHGLELLLPLSTIYLILDYLTTTSTPSEYLCPLSRILFIFFVLAVDSICLILSLELRYEASLVMLSIFLFSGVLLFTSSPVKYCNNLKSMYDYSTDDLFADYSHPPRCLGRYGKYLYLTIFAQLLRQTVPSFKTCGALTYFVYVGLTLCTLGFVITPALLGGFINALKIIGAKAGEKCSDSLRVKQNVIY